MAISTTAKTKKDVDEMTRQERLYDSLSYTYGKKGEEIAKQYDQALSQQDRALLSRGMQRSSAGMSSLGGIRNQKVKALDDNQSQFIAAYENGLQSIEEAEAARKFEAEEAEKNRNWQSGESALAREHTTSERIASQNFSAEQQEKQNAFNAEQTKLAQAFNAEQAALDREQNQSQFEAHLGFQREEAARDQSNRDIAQAFAEKQWEAQQAQWREEFDYNKMTDDQKMNVEFVLKAIETGAPVSDEMLAKAGISRADFESMMNAYKTLLNQSGGTPGKTTTGDNRTPWEILGTTEARYNEWQNSGSGLSFKDWLESQVEQSALKWYEKPIKTLGDTVQSATKTAASAFDEFAKAFGKKK